MINRKMLLLPLGLIVAAALAFVLLNNNAECCATDSTSGRQVVQALSPTGYQGQFLTTNADHVLLDVRTPQEFASGHIQGAVNISVETLASRLNEVPNGQPIVVYCRSGNRSAQASQILAQAGYTNIYDLGGLIDWTAQGFPVE